MHCSEKYACSFKGWLRYIFSIKNIDRFLIAKCFCNNVVNVLSMSTGERLARLQINFLRYTKKLTGDFKIESQTKGNKKPFSEKKSNFLLEL